MSIPGEELHKLERALIVNPYDVRDSGEAVNQALRMGLGQFRRRCGLVRQIALTAFLLGATVIEFHYVLCAAARSGCSVAG